MIRNLKNKLFMVVALFAQTVTAAIESAVIDMKDLNSLAFSLNVGDFTFSGSNYLTLKIMESDDNVNFTEATVNNNGLYEALPVLNDTGMDEKVYTLEYRGNKRYAKLRIEETGTVSVGLSVTALGLPKASQ